MKKVLVFTTCVVLVCFGAAAANAVSISAPFPIAATTHQQLSFSAAFDGTNYLVGIEGDATSPNPVGAQLVSQSGALVGPLIDTGCNGGAPLVGFDGTNYLLVWEDDRTHPNTNIYGCIISPSGTVGTPFAISAAAGVQRISVGGIAFDGTNYLVVWDDYRNGSSTIYIYGQIVSPAGSLVGAEIPISANGVDHTRDPQVAFDGSRYLVVWMSASGIGVEGNVHGCFVTKTGVRSGAFLINQTPSVDWNPIGVAFGDTGYLVTWSKDTPGTGGMEARARVISPSGSFLTPEFAVTRSDAGRHGFSRVSWNGRRYLVVWTDMIPGIGDAYDGHIYGRFFADSGTPEGSEFPILIDTGPRIAFTLACGGETFFLGFIEGDVFSSGGPYDTYGLFISEGAVPPQNASISPSGSPLGTAVTTLASVFSDANGFADIRTCRLLVNDAQVSSNAMFVQYDRALNKVYLKNDANTSWGTGYAPGTNVILQNSQCYVYVKDTTVSGSGNNLTVNWRIALKSPFTTKLLNAYMYVQDAGGLSDGWDLMGRFYNVGPQVVNITPNSGPLPIDTKTTLTSLYRDLNGWGDLRICRLLVNDALVSSNAMFLWYDKAGNKVYLKNDANTSWGTGYAPGANITLSNSQCVVYVKDITVTGVGNDLTVVWSFKLKPIMAAKNLVSWMYASDSKGLYDGWKKVGTHFTPVAPTCVSIVPSTGNVQTGTPQVFTTNYGDDNGYADISICYLQMSVTSSQANAVFLLYDAKQNKVFLRNDANTAWSVGQTPGADVTLENSQCIVHVKNTTVIPSGSDDLEIDWNIALKPSQIGKKLCERMFVRDNEWLNSGWKVKGYVRGQ